MLKMLKLLPGVRVVKAVRTGRPVAPPARADLQIRNLLDDPGLRRAMGLDLPEGALIDDRPRDDHADPVEPMLELVTEQPDALADLRRIVRNAAA